MPLSRSIAVAALVYAAVAVAGTAYRVEGPGERELINPSECYRVLAVFVVLGAAVVRTLARSWAEPDGPAFVAWATVLYVLTLAVVDPMFQRSLPGRLVGSALTLVPLAVALWHFIRQRSWGFVVGLAMALFVCFIDTADRLARHPNTGWLFPNG